MNHKLNVEMKKQINKLMLCPIFCVKKYLHLSNIFIMSQVYAVSLENKESKLSGKRRREVAVLSYRGKGKDIER
jgi:hypothetical protein